MVRGPVPFGCTMWPVQVASHISTTVGTVDGESIIAATRRMPVCNALMLRPPSVWQVVGLTMAALKFITVGSGEQCVMMAGI